MSEFTGAHPTRPRPTGTPDRVKGQAEAHAGVGLLFRSPRVVRGGALGGESEELGIRFGVRVGIVLASLLAALLVGVPGPATAAGSGCSYQLDAEGFPVWSEGCSTTVAPGRFGPLRMGRTTKAKAKATDYLAYSEFCRRWDGVAAGPDWRSKGGTLTAWRGGSTTTKGLRPNASLARGRDLYPALVRTGFWANEYVPGEGWRIYSTRTKNGWLDWYRYNKKGRAGNFFAVRSLDIKRPVTTWSQDGC